MTSCKKELYLRTLKKNKTIYFLKKTFMNQKKRKEKRKIRQEKYRERKKLQFLILRWEI